MVERPEPTPEGALIGRAARRLGVSARQIAPAAKITEGRWRQIVNGYQSVGGQQIPVVGAPAGTIARMAKAVGVTADQLEEAGRADAAKMLRDDLADEPGGDDEGYQDDALGEITDPEEQKIWDRRHRSVEWRRGMIYLLRDEQTEQTMPDQGRRRTAG